MRANNYLHFLKAFIVLPLKFRPKEEVCKANDFRKSLKLESCGLAAVVFRQSPLTLLNTFTAGVILVSIFITNFFKTERWLSVLNK